MTIDWYQKWAIYSPGKIAIKEAETGRELSYAQLNQKAEAWSAYLQKQGFKIELNYKETKTRGR